jgi:hypothetical protein
MSKLVLVSPEGQVLNDEKLTPANVVEEHQEIPLWVLAARAAEKASTHKKVNE